MQPTMSFNDAQLRTLLGVPEDGQWCRVTLRNVQHDEKKGIAKYKVFSDSIGVFLDIRVEGITRQNVDSWRLWKWEPTEEPEYSP